MPNSSHDARDHFLRCDRLLCFHGSGEAFDAARPLTHFGTLAAAKSAPRFTGEIMAFELSIERALRVQDSPGGGDTWYWLRSAAERGIISQDVFMAWEKSPTDQEAMDLLRSRGIDGLAYVNEYEDPGSTS